MSSQQEQEQEAKAATLKELQSIISGQTHQIRDELQEEQQVEKADLRAKKATEAANSLLSTNNQKAAAAAQTQVGRAYSIAAKKEGAADTAAAKIPQLLAEKAKFEAEFKEMHGVENANKFLTPMAQILGGTGDIGEMKAKQFYNLVASSYAYEKAQRTVDGAKKATQLADLQTAIIDRKSKRRRDENVEERQKAAAAKLAETKVDDDTDGDKKLMDAGLAALFGKKGPAGAGDIAAYLKIFFNEKPDDDDIAALAGRGSMWMSMC